MDQVEVREDRVATETPAPASGVAPAATTAPAAAPAAAVRVYSARTVVYPVGSRIIQLVWLIGGVINIIVALDFIFRAAGANSSAGFAHYIYRMGGWLASPFDGIFNTVVAANGTSVLRWSDLLAVAVYTAAAWILARLVRITAAPRTRVSTA
jgi:hypothetical protein